MPPSVLIVDPDRSIRNMIAALLRRAGFTTRCIAETGDMVAGDRHADVIVRDLNLAPRHRQRALEELERTAPELLQRTVIITTGPAALVKARTFAVIAKPFDLATLVDTVGQCRDRGHCGSKVTTAGLERFVRNVPRMRAVLAGDTASVRELMLRNEMRRTALDLSFVLREAARAEGDRIRAAVLRGAALVAAELAGLHPAPPLQPTRDH